MKKSELIKAIARKQSGLRICDVDLAVRAIIAHLSQAIATGEGIEIRRFGSFSLRQRQARTGRNPKNGDTVSVTEKLTVYFKPGADLREKVNASRSKFKILD